MNNLCTLSATTEADIVKDIHHHLNKMTAATNYYQRTSTPILERWQCTDRQFICSGYKKWCIGLQKQKSLFKVRGVPTPPKGIISGNLIDFTEDGMHEKLESDSYENNPANQRLDYHSDTLKQLLLSLVTDHCKSLLRTTTDLFKSNRLNIHHLRRSRSDL